MMLQRDRLLIVVISLSVGILLGAMLPQAQAEDPCVVARFQIAGTGTGVAYRMDAVTGEIVIVSPHGYLRQVAPVPVSD